MAAERCAAGLVELGVGEGSSVSWILPTWLEAMVLTAALARLGAIQNPILPIYRQREVRFIVRQSKAEILVVPAVWRKFDYEAMARKIAAEDPGLQVLVVDRDLPEGDPASLPAPSIPAKKGQGGDAPVRWLFYTSGTTADPKGARHTDETLRAFTEGMCKVLELSPEDRVAMVFPFTHIGGVGWLFCGLLSGCGHVVVEAFDPVRSIEVLARHGVTQATAGTAFHQAYLAAQRADPARALFPDVRAFPGGGAPKPPQLHYEIKKEMGGAGIVSGYGLTECPVVSMNSVRDPDDKLAETEGRPNPAGMQIKVVKADGGVAGSGEEGQLHVVGPQLCKGYLDPELNRAGFDEDGFFRTGDLGYVDADGFVVITGRLKDVIIRKGENISAKEIEDLLYEHPQVEDVAVIGLPDPSSGERCCAVVVPREASAPLGFDEMVEFLKARELMIQKIPEQLEITTELPRNPTGKILKHVLREKYAG